MKKTLFFLWALMLFCVPARAMESREALREAYAQLFVFEEDTPYVQLPSVENPYSAGEISEGALRETLEYLNFLRKIADLEPVEISHIYNYQCQHGATLLAALDELDHNAPNPGDMEKNFYDSAHLATTSSNIAKFNWMHANILKESMAYFVRDDGESNLSVLGHRRWLLNPQMSATGFGLANSESQMSYVAMYALDQGASKAQWSSVCWPSQGVFPVELMHDHLAWSISLNPEEYMISESEFHVTLEEKNLGLCFHFDCGAGEGDGFCTLSTENYGSGPCVIFRPDFEGTDFTDYVQNQVWTVTLSGLVTKDGEAATIEYQTEMASLYPQEVANIELSQLEAHLSVGQSVQLVARVIPEYADDLSVAWSSSDPCVATVDAFGNVTAIAPGECEITATSANQRFDTCKVTVLQ